MRLKIVTTLCMLAVVVLFACSGPVLGPIPVRDASKAVRRAYGVRALVYVGALLVAFAGSGVGSYLVLKRARDEYREESLKNLQALLEATKKPTQEKPPASE